jgi:hypothetical protein
MGLKSDCTIDLALRLWQPVRTVSVSGLRIPAPPASNTACEASDRARCIPTVADRTWRHRESLRRASKYRPLFDVNQNCLTEAVVIVIARYQRVRMSSSSAATRRSGCWTDGGPRRLDGSCADRQPALTMAST